MTDCSTAADLVSSRELQAPEQLCLPPADGRARSKRCHVFAARKHVTHLVDFPGGDVVVLRERDVQEALVIAQVQVRLRNLQLDSQLWRMQERAFKRAMEGDGHEILRQFRVSMLVQMILSEQPHLAAVVQDEHLAVLERGHRASVRVQVGVCMRIPRFKQQRPSL